MKKLKKFYVGSQTIARDIEYGTNSEWAHSTIESAIKHARQVMNSEGLDTAIVVQIVRVIKRTNSPVKVFKV